MLTLTQSPNVQTCLHSPGHLHVRAAVAGEGDTSDTPESMRSFGAETLQEKRVRLVFSIFPASRTPYQTKAAPALRSAAHPSVHRHPEADPLHKESQRPQRQSRSLEQTMHTDISPPVLKFCAQKTSRITGRSCPRAGGNHIGATLEFPFKTRWGDILQHAVFDSI